MSTALIIVDIQNDYFSNGKMELSNPVKAATNAAKVLEWFRQNNKDNIFHVQHIANDVALGFFLPNTEGVKLNEAVLPLEHETIITKHTPSSFLNTELEIKLREKRVTNLVILGMMTHMCIDATVRTAVELGFETTLIEDACATKDLSYQDKVVPAEQVHYAFVSALNGMYANVISTEDFLKQEANSILKNN
ncbi:cysteine hydrolase family protein [Priestia endophytica]|jgi:nicotinamidase-related amidase|uniref:Nicotinamidase-related amidase n=1 Tax=Priestia endophytica DSM 13796 TaxID=1121089 RepID=A0A1I6C834_9BACI|nr:cysteine hydrolase family protein [Priestia endophytica]KYG30348.1 isochorismatase [Priestia endophytica]RAS73126.1 cysteine hydrolase [Priestia endophytica]SFQ89304.1 Nicotinamidase-related amidase [Priestia endophytica DSM 13796]